MAEHDKAIPRKNDKGDQKHHTRQQDPAPSSVLSHSWDTDPPGLSGTPFLPRMEEHAQILSTIQLSRQRHNFIKQLHQTYGNRYVQRLIDSVKIQAKLTVNNANDGLEQEADRVADTVSKAVPSQVQLQIEEEEIQTKPIASVQPQAEEEEEIQTKGNQILPAAVPEHVETSIEQSRGDGQPLAEEVRIPMERTFGRDFSGVKVHTDAAADTLNKSLQARAFTTRQDIFFKSGEYHPGDTSGQQLLAHELTHVMQQGGSGVLATSQQDGETESAQNSAQQGETVQRREMKFTESPELPKTDRRKSPKPGFEMPRKKPKPPRPEKTYKLRKPKKPVEAGGRPRVKPARPEKTYTSVRPEELVNKGGVPQWYDSKEYQNIVEQTRQYHLMKIQSPKDYKKHWTVIDTLLKTIGTWMKKYWIFSRKVRREALTTLEGQLLNDRTRLVPWQTAKPLISTALLEKHDSPDHREGLILEYCLKRWQEAGNAWDASQGAPPAAFFQYVNSLEQADDQGLLKNIRGLVWQKIGEGAVAWIEEHKKDKKYIPRITYLPKEQMNQKKLKFGGNRVTYENSNEALQGDDFIYVMNSKGEFFADRESRTTQLKFHHSSFLAGENVAAAGHLKIASYIDLNLESGHYQPTLQHMYNAVKALKDKGVDMDKLLVKPAYGENIKKMRGRIFFEGILALKAGKKINDDAVYRFIESYIKATWDLTEAAKVDLSQRKWAGEIKAVKKKVAKLKT